METTYFTINLDLTATDAQIRRILELRNEMVRAVQTLGDTVTGALLQLEEVKAPGCSGNCKRGVAGSSDTAEGDTYNLVVENGETIDFDSLARRIADANLL